MRYLAIDLGDKRTGLAVGDRETGIVSPLSVIETAHPGERLRQIARAVDEQGPDALVVGLPLNMDGSAGPRAKLAEAFAAALRDRLGLPVALHDERLSSDAANQQMAGRGLTRGQKKARRDAVAAATILRDYFARLDQSEAVP